MLLYRHYFIKQQGSLNMSLSDANIRTALVTFFADLVASDNAYIESAENVKTLVFSGDYQHSWLAIFENDKHFLYAVSQAYFAWVQYAPEHQLYVCHEDDEYSLNSAFNFPGLDEDEDDDVTFVIKAPIQKSTYDAIHAARTSQYAELPPQINGLQYEDLVKSSYTLTLSTNYIENSVV